MEREAPADSARAGAEHLLTFPARETADQVAEQLGEEGFAHVNVARAPRRIEKDDKDGESHEWAVQVVDHRLPDTSGGGAYEGLRERFATLATDHDGRYDEPGDPRPTVTPEDL